MLSESSANASFEIRGLSIVRFSDDGVQVGADNTVIAQNFIGLFPDGSAGTIGDVGIEVINGAAGAVIGGSASDGNVIGSTRDDGVRVDDGTSTVVDLDAALGTGNNTELIKELLHWRHAASAEVSVASKLQSSGSTPGQPRSCSARPPRPRCCHNCPPNEPWSPSTVSMAVDRFPMTPPCSGGFPLSQWEEWKRAGRCPRVKRAGRGSFNREGIAPRVMS